MTSRQRRKSWWCTALATEPSSYSHLRAAAGPVLKALLPAQLFCRLSPSSMQEGHPSACENRLGDCFPAVASPGSAEFLSTLPVPEGHVTYKVPLLSSACCPSLHCIWAPLSTLVPRTPSLCHLTKMERWQLSKCPVEQKRTRKQGLQACL